MWVDLEAPEPSIISEAVRVIRTGGIILYPTDTVYGLGCDPFNEHALRKLFDLKGRQEEKGVLLLVPDSSWVSRLGVISPIAAELMECLWPGPVTMLFEPLPVAPEGVLGKGGKIGIRYPENRFLRSWLEALGSPIVSTSANLSGQPAPSTLSGIRELFEGKVDLLVEAGEPTLSRPSTVVDLEDPPRIVREGAGCREVQETLDEIVRRA